MGIKNPLLLPALGITVDLHPNAIYTNGGLMNKEKLIQKATAESLAKKPDLILAGLCRFEETPENLLVSTYVLDELSPEEIVRSWGHEEAHAIQFLGHLSKLYKELEKRGIETSVMSKAYVVNSDLIAQKVLSRNAKPQEGLFLGSSEHFGVREETRRETIADWGGYLAVDNSNVGFVYRLAMLKFIWEQDILWSKFMRIVE